MLDRSEGAVNKGGAVAATPGFDTGFFAGTALRSFVADNKPPSGAKGDNFAAQKKTSGNSKVTNGVEVWITIQVLLTQ